LACLGLSDPMQLKEVSLQTLQEIAEDATQFMMPTADNPTLGYWGLGT